MSLIEPPDDPNMFKDLEAQLDRSFFEAMFDDMIESNPDFIKKLIRKHHHKLEER